VVAPATTLYLLTGTALIVGCANTLNMWLVRDVDCLLART
jgi:heme O synthase-like polyprenyltransferase